MSLDFQQVREQVIEMGKKAPTRQQEFFQKQKDAANILYKNADNLSKLGDKIKSAAILNEFLRSAFPLEEPLNRTFPLPKITKNATILAADGSQINPDRHSGLDYCLINVGAIQMQDGTPQTPTTTVFSKLLFDEELYMEGGQITERLVALLRDLEERKLLEKLARKATAPILTLTDGPLELWFGRENRSESKIFNQKFNEYLDILTGLLNLHAITAGYIDKPRGDLVIRMLEVASLSIDELKLAGQIRPFLGVTDVQLFQAFLPPFARTAVFGIQSPNAKNYTEQLSLCFFYINIGKQNQPYLVRVETPAWVTNQKENLDLLHATLVYQSQVMGVRPYPYVLHRAHEVAVVTRKEKEQVDQMISLELRKQGIHPGIASNKQYAKDQPGRTRFG